MQFLTHVAKYYKSVLFSQVSITLILCFCLSYSFAQSVSLQSSAASEKQQNNIVPSEIFSNTFPDYSQGANLESYFEKLSFKVESPVDFSKIYNQPVLQGKTIEESMFMFAPCPILIDAAGNPSEKNKDLFFTALEDKIELLTVEESSPMVIRSQFIFLPIMKGGLQDIRREQLFVSRLFLDQWRRKAEIPASIPYIYNVQLELGNVCILDSRGIPSLNNLPQIEDPKSLDKISLELRKKYYFSLFRRWMYFYPLAASSALKNADIDVSYIQNEDQLWKAINPVAVNTNNPVK
jgi:hypothetical protein